ncbi:MAG: pseudoazurin [Pseudomonadota bacterium]
MTIQLDRRTVIIGMAAVSVSGLSVQAATTHDVHMYTKHPDDGKLRNVFDPLIQVVEAGDTVKFLPTQKGHNSVSSKGMIPEGTEPWRGKINEELSITFGKPGVYGYQCQPHAGLGMVGLIIVRGEGMTDNLEAAKAARQRGKAKKVWEEIWAKVEADGLLTS